MEKCPICSVPLLGGGKMPRCPRHGFLAALVHRATEPEVALPLVREVPKDVAPVAAVAPAVARPRAPQVAAASGRGGKRAGAGRKPGDGPVLLVRLPRALVAALDARCEPGEGRADALARLLAQ